MRKSLKLVESYFVMDDTIKTAYISDDQKYRYHLARDFDKKKRKIKCNDEDCKIPFLLAIMINPSTGDADHDDPTIKALSKLTQREGYSRLEVVNLFAYRDPKPKNLSLQETSVIVRTSNLQWLKGRINQADRILCAWGNIESDKKLRTLKKDIIMQIAPLLKTKSTFCFRLNANDTPTHPSFGRLKQFLKQEDATLLEYSVC